MRDFDDAFDHMGHVAGSAALPAIWTDRAAAFRARLGAAVEVDLPYGPGPRQRFDLVHPEGPPRGLVVFVHGGYWMRLDKSLWTDRAEGARARGFAVALPSYTLTPSARIADITREIAAAIAAAAARVSGPIRTAGHSAGGHLVTRMIAAQSPLDPSVVDRIELTLSISGLHDLRPLLWTRMNATLRLDPAEAAAESPALLLPRGRPRLVAWVGGAERPEFIRQAEVIAKMWEGFDARTSLVIDPGRNHFTVLDGLEAPDSPIVATLLEDV